jgi:F-type H+-transporting ATPase subunit b
VLRRYAFGPIQKLIDQRRDYIRDSIQQADNAREEARTLLEEHRRLVGQAKTEAEGILAEARKISDSQRERMRTEIEDDRQRRLEETTRQIEQATQQALGEIRREVASLSLIAAEKITRKSLTDDDQRRLIDEALSEIDFSQLEASSS